MNKKRDQKTPEVDLNFLHNKSWKQSF
jgi:hypothetical protein